MKILEKSNLVGIAALLVHAAKIDEKYSKKEETLIKEFINSYVKEENSDEILKLSENLEKNSNQLLNFTNVIKKESPDIIFHFAAQPLVKKSYKDTISTWETNVIGTVNLLETLKTYNKKIIVIMITSDKSYKNKECI